MQLFGITGNRNVNAFYSHIIESDEVPEGESPVFRSRLAAKELVTKFPDRIHAETLYENFQESVRQYENLPYLGTRVNDGPYEWETYKQVSERATHLGSALIQFGLQPVCIIFILFFILEYLFLFSGRFCWNLC